MVIGSRRAAGPIGDVRQVDRVTHYLQTFEHLAPTDKVARPHRRRRRTWLVLPAVALLAFWLMRPSSQEQAPPPEQAKRAGAPRIELAPAQPQPQSAEVVPPVRVVEQQGPKLIERMLAEKFGTPLPKTPPAPPRQAEPPPVVVAKPAVPAPPPPIADRPQLSEKPVVAEAPPPAEMPILAEKPPIADRPAISEKPVIAEKPPIMDRPQLAEKPLAPAAAAPQVAERPAAKPQILATAPPRLTAPLTTPRPAEAAPKHEAVAQQKPVEKPQVAERAVPAEPRAARVEEEPVVIARTERARPVVAERVPVVERTASVIERPVPVPAAVQPAVAVGATRAESAPVEAERVAVAARVSAPASRSSGPSQDAVRGLLDRYAAAWRGHDVDTLRAIGQVTNDGQANALRQYFANVGSLQVEVRVLDIRSDGDRATVRFTRRDTFRDPTGREVAKESPPIEKVVVTTPQGLRFAPAS